MYSFKVIHIVFFKDFSLKPLKDNNKEHRET